MGLFTKRGHLAPTKAEREGVWTRSQIMAHWRKIPDHLKTRALMQATADQLRVFGWNLSNHHERLLPVAEARSRFSHPDLFAKVNEGTELTPEERAEYHAPLAAWQGRVVTKQAVDQFFIETFGSDGIE
jgi:hypothetical protein